MRIAVFSDIHGNHYALEAVLRDIEVRGFELVLCGGDLVGYGAFPNEVIWLLRGRHIPTVMGNYDEGVGLDRDDCGCAYRDEHAKALGARSIEWTRQAVRPENKAYLRGLLKRLEFKVYDTRFLLVHGSPRRINEYLYENRPEHSLVRLFEEEKADVIICGHTHLPYVKELNGKRLLNSGSVGKPKDGDPRAGYLAVEVDEKGLHADVIRVPYDVEAAALAVEVSGLPVEYAAMLRSGSDQSNLQTSR